MVSTMQYKLVIVLTKKGFQIVLPLQSEEFKNYQCNCMFVFHVIIEHAGVEF